MDKMQSLHMLNHVVK